ncbi:MAG: hypothetical protein Rhims3KO_14400 [Hyphomicrobiales bacterium]
MIRAAVFLAAIPAISFSPSYAQFQCSSDSFSVTSEQDLAPQICAMAADARAELSTCGIDLDHSIEIEIVNALPIGCVGQYHCDEARITLLSMDAMQRQLEEGHPFSTVEPAAYFYSVLVHEIAHASMDGMPCPFSSCVSGQEYVAYAMQMRSLTIEARQQLLTRPDFNRPIETEEINPIIAQLAPDIFMQKAWLHFSQQEDPCGFIGQVVSGDFLFDNAFQ